MTGATSADRRRRLVGVSPHAARAWRRAGASRAHTDRSTETRRLDVAGLVVGLLAVIFIVCLAFPSGM
jgi:hypothetical protein